MKTSSLNEGDVFILDLGKTLFQWNGKQANKYEKFKGLEMITHIKDKERGGKATAVFLGELLPHASACLPVSLPLCLKRRVWQGVQGGRALLEDSGRQGRHQGGQGGRR
jgi:hypothetical protein